MIGIFSSIIIYLSMAAGTFYLSGNLGGELSILMFEWNSCGTCGSALWTMQVG